MGETKGQRAGFESNLTGEQMPRPRYRFVVDSGRRHGKVDAYERIMYDSIAEDIINPTVKKFMRNRPAAVHGARAMNAQVPSILKKPTTDWDVIAMRNAAKNAASIERELDAAVGSNMFYVVAIGVEIGGRPSEVYRVVNRVDGEPVVDVSEDSKLPPYTVIGDVKYETLKALRRRTVNILRQERFKYRWPKEKAKLWRIDAALKSRRWQESTDAMLKSLLR